MKKVYEAPAVEKIAFQYRDQVVAASGGKCTVSTENLHYTTETACDPDNAEVKYNQD